MEKKRVEFCKYIKGILEKFSEKKYLLIVFTVFALLAGTLNIFITPPLQGPDEDIHFITCWKLAHGDFSNNIPASYQEFSDAHSYLFAQPANKYSLKQRNESWAYRYTPGEKQYFYNHITFYATLSYVPPLTGVWLSSLVSDRYLPALYMGRLSSLLVYVALGVLTLYILPTGCALFFLLLLMPQSIYQASVVSYDGITNILCALWAAFVMRELFARNESSDKHVSTALCICTLLLCLCKVPYMLAAFGLLLVFMMKNVTGKWKLVWPMICSVVTVAGIILFKGVIPELPDGAEMYTRIMAPGEGTVDRLVSNSTSLTETILQIPERFFYTITDLSRLMIYGGSFVGCFGGGLDALMPPVLLGLYMLVIIFFCLNSENDLPWLGRLLFGGCGLGVIMMIFAIFALSYAPVNKTIPGITGRYFIPAAFFMVLGIKCNLLKLNWVKRNENLVLTCISAVMLTVMIVTLLQRYYFEYWWDRTL